MDNYVINLIHINCWYEWHWHILFVMEWIKQFRLICNLFDKVSFKQIKYHNHSFLCPAVQECSLNSETCKSTILLILLQLIHQPALVVYRLQVSLFVDNDHHWILVTLLYLFQLAGHFHLLDYLQFLCIPNLYCFKPCLLCYKYLLCVSVDSVKHQCIFMWWHVRREYFFQIFVVTMEWITRWFINLYWWLPHSFSQYIVLQHPYESDFLECAWLGGIVNLNQ